MGILGYTSAALGEGIYLLLEQENIVLMKFLFFLRKVYISIKINNKYLCRGRISSAIDINVSI